MPARLFADDADFAAGTMPSAAALDEPRQRALRALMLQLPPLFCRVA